MITTKIQLRFNDMDPMRRVNNSSYSSYLELARVDFCNKYLKINVLNDIPFVLVHIDMDIMKSLDHTHSPEVRMWVSKIGNTSWDFTAEIYDSVSGLIFVKARTVQVYFDYHKNVKKVIPDSFRKILEGHLN
ncbi:MAG: acyl-CoA thioesterase [Leptospiraceae bacterium]|nr:acyl-CoA thioesterase [Leptospiraceae bacterium]